VAVASLHNTAAEHQELQPSWRYLSVQFVVGHLETSIYSLGTDQSQVIAPTTDRDHRIALDTFQHRSRAIQI
jgi:hypothetical protein